MLWEKIKVGKREWAGRGNLFKVITDKGSSDLKEVRQQVVWLSGGKYSRQREKQVQRPETGAVLAHPNSSKRPRWLKQ